MNKAKKPEINKAAAQTAADNKKALKETSAAEVKTEAKTTSAAPAAKSTVKTATKKTMSKTETAAKKTAAKSTEKKTAAKSAKAAKPAAKTTAKTTSGSAAKATAKKATSAAAKTTAAKAPAKRGGRKPAPVTIDTICTKLDKKINKTKAAAIKEKIAVEIEVWGFEDGSNSYMYVEVNDGKVTVAPHNYDAKSFRVALNYANAVAFINGKTTLKKLIDSVDFYAEGNIASAVKLSAIF